MKTILITGANSGIGKALALVVAKHPYQLVLLVRKESEIQRLSDEITASTSNQNVSVFACDVSRKSQIQSCCNAILQRHPTLDVLINNAAVYTETRTETPDKIELNVAVNVVAPFLLAQGLLPALEKASNPRVYNISSIGEKYGKADFEDIMSHSNYSGNAVYNKSKLLLTMLTYKCAELYADKHIRFNCIHPGATKTRLVSDEDIAQMPLVLRAIFRMVKGFRKTPEQSAETIYNLIANQEFSTLTGKFFSNGTQIYSSAQSRDKHLIDKAWKYYVQITNQEST
ncbi:MAG: SDR family NAD(P)-dependent oxidoreductase [Candidatus Kapaibacterium sp.]|nr:MAG: SDR family NAD(P)-dependent oxidoreductase [Candidatus Kapabacteria bacterium]